LGWKKITGGMKSISKTHQTCTKPL